MSLSKHYNVNTSPILIYTKNVMFLTTGIPGGPDMHLNTSHTVEANLRHFMEQEQESQPHW